MINLETSVIFLLMIDQTTYGYNYPFFKMKGGSVPHMKRFLGMMPIKERSHLDLVVIR